MLCPISSIAELAVSDLAYVIELQVRLSALLNIYITVNQIIFFSKRILWLEVRLTLKFTLKASIYAYDFSVVEQGEG